jgi:bisphosphoglycerate-dependent phosphoglycerate mutase
MSKKKYKIYGSYQGEKKEKIDEAYSEKTANCLVQEYIIAFGKGWQIWWE